MSDFRRPETLVAAAGVGADTAFKSVAPPLHLSATYGWRDPEEKPRYDYARSGNPNRSELESALASLEGAAGGAVTASGMAAIDLILNFVNPGEKVIAPHDCYGGAFRLLSARARRGHFEVEFVDQTDCGALDKALATGAKLVLIESPSNPLLRITDIKATAAAAKKAGALVAADNTFLSPALQQPLALGCDIVLHSTTKFINGHSDVVGGAALARDESLADELKWWANCTGVTGAPFDSFLTLRGLRTLFPRIERQQSTTAEFVAALQNDERIARINYPGLVDHAGFDIARRQQKGFGSMLSVEFAEDVDVVALLRRLTLFTIAESLGGFESLACVPATMTHASMTAQARAKAGISDRLVRFSIGLEHPQDLIGDLFAALDGASAPANIAYFSKREASHAG